MIELITLITKAIALFLGLFAGAFVTWLAIVLFLLIIHYGTEVFHTLKKMGIAKYSIKNTISTLLGNKSNK